MADYTGSSFDGQRIRQLEKAREESRRLFEERRKQLEKANDVSVVSISDKFSKKTESVVDRLKDETIGRVSVDQYRKVREELEQSEKEKRMKLDLQEDLKKKRKLKSANVSRLTFLNEEDGENSEDENDSGQKQSEAEEAERKEQESLKRSKVGRDPRANAEFLPDKERDERELLEREELKKKWLEEQERIKEDSIQITYSYWDGSGHRRAITCKKGHTIGQFLDLVKLDFKELRACSVDNLMYVKEDLIIPHHLTFYELIVTKARGKSGPLFHFDVHDDVRVVSDASVEKDESHAGKVLERRWYDKNKHTFPACRWEVYDPKKSFDKYTISDNRK